MSFNSLRYLTKFVVTGAVVFAKSSTSGMNFTIVAVLTMTDCTSVKLSLIEGAAAEWYMCWLGSYGVINLLEVSCVAKCFFPFC
jgi:hypothetical protein